jgi:hypothetical protein
MHDRRSGLALSVKKGTLGEKGHPQHPTTIVPAARACLGGIRGNKLGNLQQTWHHTIAKLPDSCNQKLARSTATI